MYQQIEMQPYRGGCDVTARNYMQSRFKQQQSIEDTDYE